jgi:hypothetical protein
VTRLWLDDRGIDVRFSTEAHIILHSVQINSWAQPTSHTMCTRGLSKVVKRSTRELEHSASCSAQVKNAWKYTSTPPCRFMAWY